MKNCKLTSCLRSKNIDQLMHAWLHVDNITVTKHNNNNCIGIVKVIDTSIIKL